MYNAKLVGILLVIIACGYGIHFSYAIFTEPDTLQEMQNDRDTKNQEVRDRCSLDSLEHASGETERERIISAREWEDSCLSEYLLADINTNSGTVTPASSGVPIQRDTSIYSSQINSENEHNKSTLGHASTGASTSGGQIQPTPKIEGQGLASSGKNQSQVSTTQAITQNGGTGTQGTSETIQYTEKNIKPRDGDISTILDVLSLDDCRIVQEEDSHITKNRGHVYATDIACIRGESFTVYAPTWKKTYTVKSVGDDPILGDYIVLENENYMFVFGHTKSTLTVGEKVTPGQNIGITNKSGIWENYHVHFELWRDGYNITHDEMLGTGSRWNDEYSFRLLSQRKWYTGIDDAITFITSFEGFSDESYEDPKGSGRWSIGFGTYASGQGEKISRDEAKKRIRSKVIENMEFIYRNRLALSWNERIAVSSFFYNLGTARPEMIEALKKRDMSALKTLWMKYVNPGSIYEDGLTKRRIKEWIRFITT